MDSKFICFTDDDKNRAVRTAEKWLSRIDSEAEKLVSDMLNSLFIDWKIEFGKQYIRNPLELLYNEDRNKNRLEYIKKHEAWECAPLWANNPTELLIFLWVSEYEKFNPELFFTMLAKTIIICGQQNKSEWIPTMVKRAFWLSEIQNEIFEPHAKIAALARKNANILRKAHREERDNKVYLAYQELSINGKPKSLQSRIVQLTGLSKDQVHRAIKSLKKQKKIA